MKKLFLFLLLQTFLTGLSSGQQTLLTLADCYAGLESQYPGFGAYILQNEQYALKRQNLKTAYWPRLGWNAQASWQSEVTALPVDLSFAGVSIPGVSQDQYKTTLDLQQTLWDAGATRKQMDALVLENAVAQKRTEVTLYQLRGTVQQQFFQILLQEAYLRLNELTRQNLAAAIQKATAANANGIGTKEQVNTLKAAELQAQAAAIQLKQVRISSIFQLAQLTGVAIDSSTRFILPQASSDAATGTRPELDLFDLQQQWINGQTAVLRAVQAPKVSFFATLGYGRPGLNFLSNEFEPYALTGISAKWDLGNVLNGKNKREQQILEVQQQQIALEKENFSLHTHIQHERLSGKLNELVAIQDLEAAQLLLHTELLQISEAQLANGTTTAAAYLDVLNRENESRIRLTINAIQQALTIEQIKFITGQP